MINIVYLFCYAAKETPGSDSPLSAVKNKLDVIAVLPGWQG
jgi:hypothetical protein